MQDDLAGAHQRTRRDDVGRGRARQGRGFLPSLDLAVGSDDRDEVGRLEDGGESELDERLRHEPLGVHAIARDT